MKFLIISEFFPPINLIGTVRVGKTAKYLAKAGHDVRVVTCMHQNHKDNSLSVEIGEDKIERLKIQKFSDICGSDYSERSLLGKIYIRIYLLLSKGYIYSIFRDNGMSWVYPALLKCREISKDWSPDVVISSALPITSHFIARMFLLFHRKKTLWIAEYRDQWTGNPFSKPTHIVNIFQNLFERILMRKVDLIVSVSDEISEYYKKKYRKPTYTVYNGFDHDNQVYTEELESNGKFEVREKQLATLSGGVDSVDIFWISYMGTIYYQSQLKSICILFSAIRKISDSGLKIVVTFYTDDSDGKLESLVCQYNVDSNVKILSRVSYRESMMIQKSTDALLCLAYESSHSSVGGILSGKAFEYLLSGKPIIAINEDESHPLVREELMTRTSTAHETFEEIMKLISEKNLATHDKNEFDLSRRYKWTREYQTNRLLEFINEHTKQKKPTIKAD
jgi:glycosyltransferase involved in cell wall biosynthesis